MQKIYKVAGIEIKNNDFLMVRKAGKDIWTNLGGKSEEGETSEQTLRREVLEELGCDVKIVQYIGEFENKAALDDAIVNIKLYQIELLGEAEICDEELEEFRYIGKKDIEKGVKLPLSITEQIIPYLRKTKLINW